MARKGTRRRTAQRVKEVQEEWRSEDAILGKLINEREEEKNGHGHVD